MLPVLLGGTNKNASSHQKLDLKGGKMACTVKAGNVVTFFCTKQYLSQNLV
jgi:hypothetical protein